MIKWAIKQNEKEIIVMNYSEVVKAFASFKMKESGEKVTREELKAVREAFNAGKFNGKSLREDDEAAKKPCEGQECEGRDPEDEAEKIEEAQKTAAYKTMLSKFREWKKANVGTAAVTTAEKASLAKKVMESADNVESNVKAKIREARHAIYNCKKALREDDMAAAGDAAGQAVDAVGAAQGAMDGAAAPVDPAIVDTVTNLKTTVDTLATQCGIQPAMDPAADPNAAVPGVTGVPGADPAMAADPNAAPMMESLKAVQSRLAKREALLKEANTKNGYETNAKGVDMVMAGVKAVQDTIKAEAGQVAHKTANTETTSQIPMPSTSELVNGSKEAANRWPTEKVSIKRESFAENMITQRIQESQDSWDFAKILASGVLG